MELEELEDLEEQPLFEIDPFDVVLGQEPESDLSDADTSDDEAADTFSDLSSDAGDDFDADAVSEVPANVKHIQDMVQKLDSILTLVFEHFKPTHAIEATEPNHASHLPQPEFLPLPPLPPTTPNALPVSPKMSTSPAFFAGGSESIFPSLQPSSTPVPITPSQNSITTIRIQFNALLSIFDRTILRTFKSRYTQFLIFWFTSLDSEFADIFQGMLVERALLGSSTLYRPPHPQSNDYDDSETNGSPGAGGSMITRAAAASYIGSFVSRAVFVDADSTRRVVAVLCQFLSAQLDEAEESLRTFSSPVVVGGPQHTVFYAVAQAVFLIFCFRWRDLLDIEEDDEGNNAIILPGMTSQGENGVGDKARKWMPELGVLHRVVNSVLNPLKVCYHLDALSLGTTIEDVGTCIRFVLSTLSCSLLVLHGQ